MQPEKTTEEAGIVKGLNFLGGLNVIATVIMVMVLIAAMLERSYGAPEVGLWDVLLVTSTAVGGLTFGCLLLGAGRAISLLDAINIKLGRLNSVETAASDSSRSHQVH